MPGIMPYDPQTAPSGASTRAILAPQYFPNHSYTGIASNSLVATQQQLQHNPFHASSYSTGNTLLPFSNYIQPRPLPRLMQHDTDGGRISLARDSRQGFVEEHHSQSPPIKSEPSWTPPNDPSISSLTKISKTITSTNSSNGAKEVTFGTDIDVLMKVIQAKEQAKPQSSSPNNQSKPVDDKKKAGKKRYICTMEDCDKSFFQKTHLEIHLRAHTGVKPYPCKFMDCDSTFSQHGNLKTHERRHTGQRPYVCDICKKTFAQKGNVRAHRNVHDKTKPYDCRLDDCGKQFTQLGNLKSHQNKFHGPTLKAFTVKFANAQDGDIFSEEDKKMWEYLSKLYKNSNKGIKGRGRDRKVGSSHVSFNNSGGVRGLNHGLGYNMNGAGRSNIMVGMISSHGLVGAGIVGRGNAYEMYDSANDGSQSGSQGSSRRGPSSVSTYDDAPSDGYEEVSNRNELAFGDRIY